MDLMKLIDVKPYECFDTSIGRLCLFGLSVKNSDQLIKQISVPIQDCSAEEFVRNLVMFSCYPDSALREDKYAPNEPVLTKQEIERISCSELDIIAEKIIQYYEFLYKKPEYIKVRNSVGETISTLKYTAVEYQKTNGESNVEYLHKVYSLYEEKQKKQFMSIVGLRNTLNPLEQNKAQLFHNPISKNSMLQLESQAERTYKRLMEYINKFEKNLDSNHEIGVQLVAFGQQLIFYVDQIGYWGPDIITFYGVDDKGDSIQLIQNVSQLSFLLIAVKKRQEKPKRMGFNM